MFLDQATSLLEKMIKEMQDVEPEKRDHFIKSAVTLLEISTETLKHSPEFREAFAKVHSEFFKYPECANTLEEGLRAYQEYLE